MTNANCKNDDRAPKLPRSIFILTAILLLSYISLSFVLVVMVFNEYGIVPAGGAWVILTLITKGMIAPKAVAYLKSRMV